MNVINTTEYTPRLFLEEVITPPQYVESSLSGSHEHYLSPPEYNKKDHKVLKEVPVKLVTKYFDIDVDWSRTTVYKNTNSTYDRAHFSFTPVYYDLFDELQEGTTPEVKAANTQILRNKSQHILSALYPEAHNSSQWNDYRKPHPNVWSQNVWIPIGLDSSSYATTIPEYLRTPEYYTEDGTPNKGLMWYPLTHNYTFTYAQQYLYSTNRNVNKHFVIYNYRDRKEDRFNRMVLMESAGYKLPVNSHTISISENKFVTCISNNFEFVFRLEAQTSNRSPEPREKPGFIRNKTPICFIESMKLGSTSIPCKIHKVVKLDGSDFDTESDLAIESDLVGSSPTHSTTYRLQSLRITIDMVSIVTTEFPEQGVTIELPYKKNKTVTGRVGIIHDRLLEEFSQEIKDKGLEDARVKEFSQGDHKIFESYFSGGRHIDSLTDKLNASNIWLFELLYPNLIENLTWYLQSSSNRMLQTYEQLQTKLIELGYCKPVGQIFTTKKRILFDSTTYSLASNEQYTVDYGEFDSLVDYTTYDRRIIEDNINQEDIIDKSKFYGYSHGGTFPVPHPEFVVWTSMVSHALPNSWSTGESEDQFIRKRYLVPANHNNLNEIRNALLDARFTNTAPYTFYDVPTIVSKGGFHTISSSSRLDPTSNTKETTKEFLYIAENSDENIRTLVFQAGTSWFYVTFDQVIQLKQFEKLNFKVKYNESYQ